MNIPTKNISAVYCIENVSNGRKYVGATDQLRDRIRTHHRLLKKGTHPSALMQEDFSRGDVFFVSVLKEFPPWHRADMLDHEYTEIVRLDSVSNGYNKQIPAKNHHVGRSAI